MQGERSAPKETVTKHDLPPLRAEMVFLLSGLGSGLGDASVQRWTSLKRLKRVCYHPNEMTLSDVSPSPIHVWIMKSTSPALQTNSSHSSPRVCRPFWVDRFGTNWSQSCWWSALSSQTRIEQRAREYGKKDHPRI